MKNPRTGRPFFQPPPPKDRCAICGCDRASHSRESAFVPSTVRNAEEIRDKARRRRGHARRYREEP